MNSLLLYLYAALLMLLLSGCIFGLPGDDPPCRDAYGEFLYLEVPIRTSPSQDTFRIGDTLWVEANISKDVAIKDRPLTIYLDSFEFRTSLIVSEISGEEENFFPAMEVVEFVGSVEDLPLPTLFSYAIRYEATADSYHFKAALVFSEPGRYYVSFSTGSDLLLRYAHPALLCNGNRREEILIFYTNPSTTYSNYENILRASGVPYLQTGSFERRQGIGAHAFIVTE